MPPRKLLNDSPPETAWRVDARCRSKNAGYFFAPPHLERRDDKRGREAMARELCGGCLVQAQCLDYALRMQEPHGIWGGLNELERRRVLRRRQAEGQCAAG